MPGLEKRGRLAMTAHGLNYFFGPEGVEPYHEELSYDEITKDIVLILEDEHNNKVVHNTIKELRDYINDLKNSGIFTSAAAFVNNRKIYRFYFDLSNGSARLDPELPFDPLYRYYAIREISTGPNGEYIYVTGVKGLGPEENEIMSHLVDMNQRTSESGDGKQESVAQVAGIIREIVDGNTYVVEFYDASRNLVNILSFQALAARVADIDLSPDTAVVDMYITTNRAMEGDSGACFLYRGETANKLEIRVYLKYADGRTRDVTYENVTNGRLIIQGLNELATDTISQDGDTLQQFSVVYTLIRSNASLPQSPQETQGGAVINPQSLTITKDMKVYVLEDIFTNLEKVYCLPYVQQATGGDYNLGDKIRARFFGLYENGAIYDITNICTYTNPGGLQENDFGETQHLSIRVPYGNAGNFKVYNFDILCPEGSRHVQVNGQPIRVLEANRQSYVGFSGAFTKIGLSGGTGIDEVALNSLLASSEVEFHGVTPNYIRIRDIIDSIYNYSEMASSFGGSGIGYTTTQQHEIVNFKPVLVEFIKVNFDENNIVTNIFKTGAMLHYIKVTDGI
jgi:hypothetical protein